jgi:FkbM family methyltransferase
MNIQHYRQGVFFSMCVVVLVMNVMNLKVRPSCNHIQPPYTAAPTKDDSIIAVPPRKIGRLMQDIGLTIPNAGEPPFFHPRAKRNMLVVDVGCNDGSDYVIPAVSKNGHTVLAFDPMRTNVEALERNANAHNLGGRLTRRDASVANMTLYPLMPEGHIYLFEAAVSDSNGHLTMYHGSALSGKLDSPIPQDFYGEEATSGPQSNVMAVRLDAVVAQDVYILKIDTQGHELQVLLGATQLFLNFRVQIVMLEFWPKGMLQGGSDPLRVLDLLRSFGFACFDISAEYLPASRPDDFEGFVAAFNTATQAIQDPNIRAFGAWEDLFCYNMS